MTHKDFLNNIELFLLRHKMSATRFGEIAANDRHFVHTVRKGRSPTMRKVHEVTEFMNKHVLENKNSSGIAK